MTDLRKAAEMALEALEWNYGTDLENIENCMAWLDKMNATIPALRKALQEDALALMVAENQRLGLYDDQKPVAWVFNRELFWPSEYEILSEDGDNAIPLYTAPPPNREWVGLTDEDLKPLCDEWKIMYGGYVDDFAKTIEAKLKEKNT